MDEIYSTPPALGHCFECGNPAHFKHHVIPLALGGKQTVPLCAACHGSSCSGVRTYSHVCGYRRSQPTCLSRRGR
jgi:hypothetical protein